MNAFRTSLLAQRFINIAVILVLTLAILSEPIQAKAQRGVTELPSNSTAVLPEEWTKQQFAQTGEVQAQSMDELVIAQGEQIHVYMSEDGNLRPFKLKLNVTASNSSSNYSWRILTPAKHGQASVYGKGSEVKVDYMPGANYTGGEDSFVVQVSNNLGSQDKIVVLVSIYPSIPFQQENLGENRAAMQMELASGAPNVMWDPLEGMEYKSRDYSLLPVNEVNGLISTPYFYVLLPDNIIECRLWPADSSVTLTIDDPATGVGIDYTDTQILNSSGSGNFYTGTFQLIPGQEVTITDGITTKTHTIKALTITTIDQVTDTVSGTGDPGIVVDASACNIDPCSWLLNVTPALDGTWSADFSTALPPVDIQPGTKGSAIQFDEEGNYTEISWSVKYPFIEVGLDGLWLFGNEWPLGNSLTLSIDDPGNGSGVDYTETKTVIANPDNPDQTKVEFDWPTIGIGVGTIVTMSDGTITKDLTVELSITNYDVAGDTITGTSVLPRGVWVDVWTGDHYVCRSVTPDVFGSWTADYSIGDSCSSEIVDLVPEMGFWATDYDSDKDMTRGWWNFPIPPDLDIYILENNIQGKNWLIGETVTLTIDDPGNGAGVDYSDTALVVPDPGSPTNGIFKFEMSGFTLQAGQIVTVTDGATIKTHTITNLTVTEVDPIADTVSGTAEAGSQVYVGQVCDLLICTHRLVIADEWGNWIADFSSPGANTDEADTYNIVPGDASLAMQTDPDYDSTVVSWHVPKPVFEVYKLDYQIDGNDWPIWNTVTLTIDDPGNGVGVDYTDSIDVTPNPSNPTYGIFKFDVGDFTLLPGQLVTITDGIITKSHTITALTLTEVDPTADTVRGTAVPGSDVVVRACNDSACNNLSVVTDPDGNWNVDFTAASPVGDILPGIFGYAAQFNEDGDTSTNIGWSVNNPEPENNAIGSSTLITSIPSKFTQDTLLATSVIDDPNLVGCDRQAGLASVWYKFSPVTTRSVSLDTTGSDYNTMIGVWSGDPGSLIEVVCNDDMVGNIRSAVTFIANAGSDYYIGISQYNGSISGLGVKDLDKNTGSDVTFQSGGNLVFNVTTFADALGSTWYWKYVEGFYAEGITTGCGTNPFRYCPDRAVTRAEMAVFILRAQNGASYIPSPAVTGMFSDVPVTGKEWMKPWIEEFYATGMTTGCAASPLRYCPERQVTRAEMAVFVLRAVHGAGYVPPAVTGVFSDVPVAGKEWMQAWIEQFYREGITTGCGQAPLRYCPEQSVTRAEMATFIDRAFGFPQLP